MRKYLNNDCRGEKYRAYIDNLNKLIAGTEFADLPLEKIVAATGRQAGKVSHLQQCGPDMEPHVLLAVKTGNAELPLTMGMKPC